MTPTDSPDAKARDMAKEYHEVEGYTDQHRQMFVNGFLAGHTEGLKEREGELESKDGQYKHYYQVYKNAQERIVQLGGDRSHLQKCLDEHIGKVIELESSLAEAVNFINKECHDHNDPTVKYGNCTGCLILTKLKAAK